MAVEEVIFDKLLDALQSHILSGAYTSKGVIAVLEKFRIKPTPEDFHSLYVYALVRYAIKNRANSSPHKDLVWFFKNEDIEEAFEQRFRSNGGDSEIIQQIQIALETTNIGQKLREYDINPQNAVSQLYEMITTIANEISTPAEIITHRKLDNLAQALQNIEAEQLTKTAQQRRLYLIRQHNLSLARCERKWVALGVAPSKASSFASDASLGSLESIVKPTVSQPIVVLLAELGMGKSLAAERWFQETILIALKDETALIPVFVNEFTLQNTLQQTIDTQLEKLELPEKINISLVIDGIDTKGFDAVCDIIFEVFQLLRSNVYGSFTCLVTTTPLYGLVDRISHFVTIHRLELLSRETLKHLLENAQDLQQFPYWQFDTWYDRILTEQEKELYRRPVFTLLEAYRQHQQLLGNSVENDTLFKAFTDKLAPEHINVLERVAATYLDHNTPIHLSYLSLTPAEQAVIRDSKLITGQGEYISFTLPIIAYFFGASLLSRDATYLEDATNDVERLASWKEAIKLLLNGNFVNTVPIFTPLVEEQPALAYRCIRDGLHYPRNLDDIDRFPSINACREQIVHTTRAWRSAVGNVLDKILPFNENGEFIFDIELSNEREWIHVNFEIDSHQIRQSSRAMPKAAWAWKWSHKLITDHLEATVKKRVLPLNEGVIKQEDLWYAALSACYGPKAATYNIQSIELNLLEAKIGDWLSYLRQRNISGERWSNSHRYIIDGKNDGKHNFVNLDTLSQLSRLVQDLKTSGTVTLNPPWPVAQSWEQKRTTVFHQAWIESVYNSLLDVYPKLVDQLFGTIKRGMPFYLSFPCEFYLNYHLNPSLNPFVESTNSRITTYYQPLDYGANSRLIIDSEINSKMLRADEFSNRLRELRKKRRPQVGSWVTLSISSSGAHPVTPYTKYPIRELFYKYLIADLRYALGTRSLI